MTPEEVVGAIWDRWERDLADWDLEGATANAEACRLAVEAVADVIRPVVAQPENGSQG